MIVLKNLRLTFPLLVIGLASTALIRADLLSAVDKFLQKDVDVITVTDIFPEGRLYTPATPENPVRYKIINFGYTVFNDSRIWANESIPSNREVLIWMIRAMRTQGYLLADATHPPEQIFVFSWGMKEGGTERAALGFLGGDKLNLMWEQVQYGGFVDQRVLLRGLIRTGMAGKVWDVAESDLFIGVVRSFAVESFDTPKRIKLWETRFGCPATGHP